VLYHSLREAVCVGEWQHQLFRVLKQVSFVKLQDFVVFAPPTILYVLVYLFLYEPRLFTINKASGHLQKCLKFRAFLSNFKKLERTLHVHPYGKVKLLIFEDAGRRVDDNIQVLA
jgi:hypothetical protein